MVMFLYLSLTDDIECRRYGTSYKSVFRLTIARHKRLLHVGVRLPVVFSNPHCGSRNVVCSLHLRESVSLRNVSDLRMCYTNQTCSVVTKLFKSAIGLPTFTLAQIMQERCAEPLMLAIDPRLKGPSCHSMPDSLHKPLHPKTRYSRCLDCKS